MKDISHSKKRKKKLIELLYYFSFICKGNISHFSCIYTFFKVKIFFVYLLSALFQLMEIIFLLVSVNVDNTVVVFF